MATLSSLEEASVIAFDVALQRPSGCKEPRPRSVVAMRVDGGRVLLMVHFQVMKRLFLSEKVMSFTDLSITWFEC